MNEEMKERARKLYRPNVFGYKRVAQELGVSTTTARRWIDPEYEQRLRVVSNEAKRRRRGVCERCGGETRYNGHTVNGASRICKSCSEAPWSHCLYGHPLTPENRLESRTQGHVCRLCRNEYQREYMAARRRAEGRKQRGPYHKARLPLSAYGLESEGAALE